MIQLPKTASDYTTEFAATHPEVGEVRRGALLSSDALQKLGQTVHSRILKSRINETIYNKPASQQERTFARSAADMLSRSLLVTVQENPGVMKNGQVASGVETMVAGAYSSDRVLKTGLSQRMEGVDISSASSHQVCQVLDAVVGIVQQTGTSAEEYKAHDTNMGDIVQGAFIGLRAIAEEKGGLPVTTYLEGNLQNLIAQYELLPATE